MDIIGTRMNTYHDIQIRSLLLGHNELNWQSAVKQLLTTAVDYEEQENKRDLAGKLFAEISAICVEYGDLERAEMTAEDALSILSQDVPVFERGLALRTLALVCFAKCDGSLGKSSALCTDQIEQAGECVMNANRGLYPRFIKMRIPDGVLVSGYYSMRALLVNVDTAISVNNGEFEICHVATTDEVDIYDHIRSDYPAVYAGQDEEFVFHDILYMSVAEFFGKYPCFGDSEGAAVLYYRKHGK